MSEPSVKQLFEDGNRLVSEGKWADAVANYEAALSVAPDHEWAFNNLGYCLQQLGRLDEAEFRLRRAIALNPKNAMAHANLVSVLNAKEQRTAAIPWLRRLIELRPDVAEHPFNLANALMSMGRAREAVFYYRQAIESAPHYKVAISNYLLCLNYSDGESVDAVAREHFRYAQEWARPRKSSADFSQSRDPSRRIRLGYLSSDFAQHPVGKLIRPILAAHDRSQFEVYAYCDSAADDYWTRRIQQASHVFVRTAGLSDDELLSRITREQIDILVELGGHTGGRNRLALLAAGAAPVQVSFLGYPNTTGLTAIDYRITDRFCDPPGQTERLHSERLARLEHGFLCYELPEQLPPVASAPAESQGVVKFGTFNNPSKISGSALDAWGQILSQVPHSRLLIKYGNKYSSEELKEKWRESFATLGVDPSRLEFSDTEPTLVGHFRRMGSVDIALDSFPYQGTMTSLETLSMGVPLITLAGETYSRRASSAMLLHMGLKELVAETPSEYVAKAVELAYNRPLLNTLRSTIREKLVNSSLCDVAGFVKELESALRGFWQEECAAFARGAAQRQNPGSQGGVVICSGMPRSGSTWSYNVCRLLLEAKYGACNVDCGYHEGPAGDQHVRLALNDSAQPHLIKLHYPGPEVDRQIRENRVKNIYTSRHPLAALASFKEKFKNSPAEIAKRLRCSLEAADRWKAESTTLFIDFDEILDAPRDLIRRIANYLGHSPISEELVEKIDKETCLDHVRQLTTAMAAGNAQLVRDGNDVFDPRTQYHLNHAPKGRERNWRAELTGAELKIAEDLLGPWLERWETIK